MPVLFHTTIQARKYLLSVIGLIAGMVLTRVPAMGQFTDVTSTSIDTALIEGFETGEMIWADFNGDGVGELFVSGKINDTTPGALMYVQDIQGEWVPDTILSQPFVPVFDATFLTPDLDGDGIPELFYTGIDADSNYVVLLYTFTGTDFLLDNAVISNVIPVSGGDGDWADYDQDGDMDLILSGLTESGSHITRIYQNQSGVLIYQERISLTLAQISHGRVRWEDFNQDGSWDILITGALESGDPVTEMYLNNNDGTWQAVSDDGLPDLMHSSVDIIDYDNDGDQDLVLSGMLVDSSMIGGIYNNDGWGGFSMGTFLETLEYQKTLWGDFTEDGISDLVLLGKRDSLLILKILIQDTSTMGTFQDSTVLDTLLTGFMTVGDADNNGSLDIFLSGRRDSVYWRIWGNDTPDNVSPALPQNVSALQEGTRIILEWDLETDVDYGYFLKSNGASGFLYNTQADTTNGFRRVYKTAQLSHNGLWELDNLPPGTYTFGIQAIDRSGEGSAFQKIQFLVNPLTLAEISSFYLPPEVTGLQNASISVADINLDGDMDVVLMGEDDGQILTRVWLKNEGGGTQYTTGGFSLTGLTRGDMAWEDYDLDGDPDLLMSGWDGNQRRTILYQNNPGNETLSVQSSAFAGVDSSTVDWADFDSDGDADVLLTGFDGTAWRTILYRNDGGGIFTEISDISTLISGFSRHTARWVDYDRDGDPDLWVSGLSEGAGISNILINTQGSFSDAGIGSLQGPLLGRIAVADMNRDHYPDILIMGEHINGEGFTRLYKNDNGTGFTLIDTGLPDLTRGKPAWGDYDNDGDVDLLLTGSTNRTDTSRNTSLFINQGNDILTKDSFSSSQLVQLGGGSAAVWLDLNENGELDLLLTGNGSAGTSVHAYENLLGSTSASPEIPSQLSSNLLPDGRVQFNWSTSPGSAGSTYNLFLGTSPQAGNRKSPLSNISNGNRYVLNTGNLQHAESWIWEDPLPGNYFWSVQTIDGNYKSSDFADLQVLTIEDPEFSDFTPASLPGLSNASADWGDFDNDGDLDLVVLGGDGNGPFTQLYVQQSDGSFIPQGTVFPQMSDGDVAWGDYNRDGNLDLILTGIGGSDGGTMIYRNEGNGNLTLIQDNILDVFRSSVDWGDYDKDNDLDILISGLASGRSWTKVYRNEGNDQFVDTQAALDTINAGSAVWGDYDNDGDLDILLSGNSLGSIYENQGNGFEKRVFLRNLINSDAEWVDYDNDGFLDVILTGLETDNGGDRITIVYRNVPGNAGNRSFQQVISLSGVEDGSLSPGDYDGDGWVDLLLSGKSSELNYVTQIFRQINGQFVLDSVNSTFLPDIAKTSVSEWVDIDSDGKLDILLIGQKENGDRILNMLKNDLSSNTFSFGSPQNISQTQVNQDMILSWEPPAQGAEERYTYALYLGNASKNTSIPGAISLENPMSDLATGFRKIVRNGDVRGNSFRLSDLTDGTYYWSVQAIDKDYEGSEFAPEQSFTFRNPNFVDSTPGFPTAPTPLYDASISWVDYDTDRDLDFILTGLDEAGNPRTILFANRGNGIFDEVNINLPDIHEGEAIWADYDHDGDPDLLITGTSATGPVSQLFQNDGGSFSLVNAGFMSLSQSSAAWGDIDNDGDQDLIITGVDESGVSRTELYRNEDFASFSEITHNLKNVRDGDVAWGDFDNDGDLDLLLTGLDNADLPVTRIYRNSSGLFEELNPGFAQVGESSVAWGDYNNDGLLDILLSGRTNPAFTAVYRNLGNNAFQEIALNLDPVSDGKVAWGDYNNDGFRDIFITGTTDSGQGFAKIFRNNLGAGFTADENSSILFPGVGEGSTGGWADVNNDGKLDLLISGRNPVSGENQLALLTNDLNIGSGTLLPSPVNVRANQMGDRLMISWDPPAGYDSDLVDGLTYAISLVPQDRDTPPLFTESDPGTGVLYIPRDGNRFHTTFLEINGLQTGTYELSVQAVSPGFIGSEFSEPVVVAFQAPELINVTGTVFTTPLTGVDNADASWADYDDDGDLDVIIQGLTAANTSLTELYTNENGLFVKNDDASQDLEQVDSGNFTWGDYDNDGDVDLLLSGLSSNGSVTKLYQNNDGSFTEIAAGLTGVFNSDLKWVDIDNDGWLDISVIGNDGVGKVGQIYRNQFINNPTQPFTLGNAFNVSLDNGAQAWTDVDRDGDRDVLLIGSGVSDVPVVSLQLNDGQGNFTQREGTGIAPLGQATAYWGSYDNDLWPDLMVSGIDQNGNPITTVYRNNQDYTFTAVTVDNIGGEDAFWGDWDEDGDWDITLSGDSIGGETLSRLYLNENGVYNLKSEDSDVLENVGDGSFLRWGDYNADGYPDLLIGGRNTQGDRVIRLYQNTTINPTPKPRVPTVPSGLTASQDGNRLIFTWEPPSGTYPAGLINGLSYNFYIGLGGGVQNIQSAIADLNTGNRKILTRGNAFQTRRWVFEDLSNATYSWGVQAVDADYEGSAFIQGNDITFESPDWNDITTEVLPAQLTGISAAKIIAGDYDRNGDMDFLIMGTRNTQAFTNLYRNQEGQFQIATSNLPATRNAAMDWGDYNRDGFIDLLVTGNVNNAPVTRIYINNNGVDFSNSGVQLEGVENGDAAWIDYDNDGDLDIIYMGNSVSGPITRLYINQGGAFINSGFVFPGLTDGSIAIADYNNDGYTDIFLTGSDGVGAVSRLYQNNAGNGFVAQTFTIQNLRDSHADWVDYDNDGDQDLFITGITGNNRLSRLYRNDVQANQFVSVNLNIPGLNGADVVWADINLDGLRDAIISGQSDTENLIGIYLNEGQDGFRLDTIGSGVLNGGGAGSAIAVGDFDDNGVLDISLAGTALPNNSLRIVDNLIPDQNNSRPGIPANISSTQNGRSMLLSWNPPLNDDENISSGYTYNIYVGDQDNPLSIRSPQSIRDNGRRLVLEEGLNGNNRSFQLRNLATGTYFWSVQSIGQDYEASAFSGVDSFIYVNPIMLDSTTRTFGGVPAGFSNSALAWGDYNNDNVLDLVISGETPAGKLTRLYRGTGKGLVNSGINTFANVSDGSLAWADYNLDGNLDLLLTGMSDQGPVSILYINNGNQSFNQINTFAGVSESDAQWGDFDNDGDPDIALSGLGEDDSPISMLYRNDGGNEFNEIEDQLANVRGSTIDWYDYNNDGYVDLVLAGTNASGFPITRLYANNRLGNLVNSGIVFDNLSDGDISFGDYNNDGFADILFTGTIGSGPVTKVYRNNGGTSFNEVFSADGGRDGTVAWGDYNNDGFRDFFVAGVRSGQSGERFALIYRNDGGNSFSVDSEASVALTGFANGEAAWADYDLDSRLDLAVIGNTDGEGILRIYHNETLEAPSVPGTPANLVASQEGEKVILEWNAPQIPSPGVTAGFTYNVYVRKDNDLIISPQSDINTGFFRVAQDGNAFNLRRVVLEGLTEGSYSWGVQAVDGDYQGSSFTTGNDFTYVSPDFQEITEEMLDVEAPYTEAVLSFGDFNGDKRQDLIVSGLINNTPLTRLYANEALGEFALVENSGLEHVSRGDLAWGDYDNDGDLDLAISGQNAQEPFSAIYRNDGGNFVRLNTNIDQVTNSALAWGDLDNDGDLDLILSGTLGNNNPVTRIYLNNRNDNFTLLPSDIPGVRDGSIALGDYDSDLDLDLLITGSNQGTPVTMLWINNGDGTFSEAQVVVNGLEQLQGVVNGNAEWGDFNNDGWIDILLAGSTGTANTLRVYLNNSNGFFSPVFNIMGVSNGEVAWGDINKDNYLDIIIAGEQQGTFTTSIYLNDRNGSFILDDLNSESLIPVGAGSGIALSDINLDGTLDLAVAGTRDLTNEGTLKIYRNEHPATPIVIPAPVELTSTQNNEIVELSWQIPPGIAQNIANGLSYNIYVGRQPGGIEFQAPMTYLDDGTRQVTQIGPVSGTRWRLEGLSAGTYYWSVQAVDQRYQGSVFANEQSFIYSPPDFIDRTSEVFTQLLQGLTDADLSWIDFDNDNELDLLVTGLSPTQRITRLFRNNGGQLTSFNTNVINVSQGDADWANFDNSGGIDLALIGLSDTGAVSLIYRNQNNAFTRVQTLEGVSEGSVRWGDFDNDGRPDLLLTGQSSIGDPQTDLYRNTQNQGFVLMNTNLAKVARGMGIWGDMNRDGWEDIVLTGETDTGAVTIVYLNDKQGGFDPVNTSLPGTTSGNIVLLDANNDGFLDIILTGNADGNPISNVYQNLGNNQFTLLDQLEGIFEGKAAWGDFNDDGYPDVTITGTGIQGATTSLYRNIEGLRFEKDSLNSAALQNVALGSDIAWGDFDNDSKLDLIMAGGDPEGTGKNLILYKNVETNGNRRSGPPTSLRTISSGKELTFVWSPPTGYIPNLIRGLTYNIYIGTTPGITNISAPESGLENGYRRILRQGSLQDTTWTITNLPSDTYYWSVQAIDPDFEGSRFADEQAVEFTLPIYEEVRVISDSLVGIDEAATSWGDFDNDGDLDLIATGRSQNANTTWVYQNNGQDTFQRLDFFLPRVRNGNVEWFDYNNDGFLDIILSGETSRGLITNIYRSDSANAFTEITARLPGILSGDIDWGDFDNDGDLDIALCGIANNSGNEIPISRIFVNQGGNNFRSLDFELPGVTHGVIEWVDFDRDGSLDLFVSGNTSTGSTTRMYRNAGNKSFDELTIPLAALGNSSASWGDYNNDGNPDVLLSGEKSDGNLVSYLYRNDDGEGFTGIDSLIGVANGSIHWGDYNEDGFADILISGEVQESLSTRSRNINEGITAIYENRAGQELILDSVNTPILSQVNGKGQVNWIDYDHDGKLDILIGGRSTEDDTTKVLTIFRNISDGSADPRPLPPILGTVEKGENRVTLSWNPPSGGTSVDGYTYNLSLESRTNSRHVISPMSDLQTGKRKVVKEGNAGSGNEWTIIDLPTGTYYWTVQSVDQEYETSEFAVVDSFEFIAARFIDVSDITLPDDILGFTAGDMDFGDFDHDEDLDLLICGETDSGFVSALYENVGQSRFVKVDLNMQGLSRGGLEWGDINNDGFLDAVITGTYDGINTVTNLYINTQNDQGKRTLESVPTNLPGIIDGDILFGDYNNDGYLDLLLTGFSSNSSTDISRVYQNNGQGGFGQTLEPLGGGLRGSSAAWGDYDNDGDLDIALTGRADIDKKTVVFENRYNEVTAQDRVFRELPSTRDSLIQVSDGNIQWGDYDNDGDLDLLLTGEDFGGNLHTSIYSNLGNDLFSSVDFNLPGIVDGEAKWGDYDEDGTLDVLISGRNGLNENNRITQLYLYNSFTSSFTPDLTANGVLEDVNGKSSVEFVDYDRNGLLDIIVAGRSDGPDTTRTIRIYQNKIGVAPLDIAPPIDLTVTEVRSGPDNTFELDLSWAPADSSEITRGYSYNLVFTNGGTDNFIVTPQADTLDGFRRVVELGNVSQNFTWSIKDLPEGSYRWTVQAIDQSYQASDFASWATLTLEIPSYEDETDLIFEAPPTGLSHGSISIGDVDNDEDLDFVITGQDALGRAHTTLYIYSRTNSQYQVSPFSNRLVGVTRSSSDWADYDLDGDLDLLISGVDTTGTPTTRLYRNNGSGNFVVDTLASNTLPQLVDASVAWGDYNNDGYADILLTGNTIFSGKITAVYRNDRDGNFSRLRNPLGVETNEDFEAVDRGSVAWGDYNKDGHLDFIISGQDEEGDPFTAVYRNLFFEDEVDNRFSLLKLTNADVFDSSVDWGDVNNDGFLDVVLSGFGGRTIGLITAIYIYDPLLGRFDPQTLPISRVQRGQVFMGDYNFDGFRDILISGQTVDTTFEAQVIPNSGGTGVGFGQDLRSSSKLIGVTQSSAVWGDLGEPDGKLDIIMSGIDETGTQILKLYRNERNGRAAMPPVATNLQSEDVGLFLQFSWDKPQGFDSTLVDGLTYNLIVVRERDTTLQVSPQADTIRGLRRVVKLGNAGHHTVWNLTQIPTGCYKWGIQVVNAQHEGGEFVFGDEEVCFQAPLPNIIDSSFVRYFPWGGDMASSWIEVEDTTLVREVRVWYSPISSLEEDFIILERKDNRYTFDMTSDLPLMDPEGRMIGVDYFFEVRGRFATNQVRTGKKYAYIRFSEDVDDMNLTDNTLIRYGIDRSFYNILSIPLNLTDSGIRQVLDELGAYDKKKWRMFATLNNEYAEYSESESAFTDFEPGRGYWLIIGSPDESDDIFPGEGTTVEVTESQPFEITLTPGWNQIGNPYNFNISWDDVIDEDINPGSSTELEDLRTFKFTLNNNADVIERFSGGIVMAHSEITLKIPVLKNPVAQRLSNKPISGIEGIRNPLHYATWRVDLKVETGGLTYSSASFGMDRNAKFSRDPLDRMRMPRFDDPEFTYLDLTFEHPEYFYPYFAKDIVPSGDSHIWEFYISSNNAEKEIRIQWDNEYFGNGDQELILFDVEKQRAFDMRKDSLYISSSTQIDRPFRIYYGPGSFIDSVLTPDRILLGEAYPNPFNKLVNIPFTLVDRQQGDADLYQVTLNVYNLMGQEVYRSRERSYQPGFHEIGWDGKDKYGKALAQGTYIYMIQVWDGTRSYQATGRIVKN